MTTRERALGIEPNRRVTVETEPGFVRVRLQGEIDFDATHEVRSCAAEAVAMAGTGGVVIDLSDCTFMDSSGLNALVGAVAEADRRDCALRITGATGIVLRVMQLTDLDSVLPLADD
jgi:anti-sigma B factor antagonist